MKIYSPLRCALYTETFFWHFTQYWNMDGDLRSLLAGGKQEDLPVSGCIWACS